MKKKSLTVIKTSVSIHTTKYNAKMHLDFPAREKFHEFHTVRKRVTRVR